MFPPSEILTINHALFAYNKLMVEINNNFHNLNKSTTLAINEKSNELLSQGREVYKFGLGQSPFPVPDSVAKELQRKAERLQQERTIRRL